MDPAGPACAANALNWVWRTLPATDPERRAGWSATSIDGGRGAVLQRQLQARELVGRAHAKLGRTAAHVVVHAA
jgi:hypothetical protein